MQHERRVFLARSTRLLALAMCANAFTATTPAPTTSYPFSLGVASGSPRPTSIVLWTRVLPDALNAESIAPVPFSIEWEISEDDAFKRIVAKGSAVALPELAHSVHVDATGLHPDRWY